MVIIELISPERGNLMPYPPSQVRLLIGYKKPEPHTRYEEINRVLKEISSGFEPFKITFRRAPIRGKSYVDIMIRDIKLRYYNDFVSYKSPIASVQEDDAAPLRGRADIPALILLLSRKFFVRQCYANFNASMSSSFSLIFSNKFKKVDR